MDRPPPVAIVTGSTRGIGRAVAARLLASGALVTINGTDRAQLLRTAEELGDDVLAIGADVTSPTAAAQLVEETIERWGRLDIVVNNAGFNWDAPADAVGDDELQAMLDVHVIAPVRILRAAAPHLLADAAHRPQRKVVNVSSVSGTMGSAGQLGYSAAKAGLVGATKALAKEWGPHGVNVNAVAPGFIATRLTAPREDGVTLRRGGRAIPLGLSAARRDAGRDRVPLGRMGTPREVADAVAFLCHSDSDYVHGQVLAVSGGLTLGMER